MALLTWLQESALSIWISESSSILAFPTVLTLHTFGLMLLVGTSWALDLRLLGIARRIPIGSMRTLFPVMWTGFWISAATGSMLFTADATDKGTSLIFWSKLLFVAVGLATAVPIQRIVRGMSADPVAIGGTARLLAVTSLLAWAATITAGRLLAYFN